MNRLILLSLVFLFLTSSKLASGQDASVQLQGIESTTKFEKIDKDELLKRYPVGKHWRANCNFRCVGTGSKTSWGLSGECHFTMSNEYTTEIKVIENDGVIVRMRLDVIDARRDRWVTKKQMKWVGFDTNEPIFKFALASGLDKVVSVIPQTSILLGVATIYDKIDPGYRNTLTKLANKGVLPFSIGEGVVPELSLVETASDLSGCSFDLQWMNGYGLSKATQLKNSVEGTKVLGLERLRELLMSNNIDPLVDLYVMPTINRKRGDKWSVDMGQVGGVLTGSPEIRSSGKMSLHYTNDGNFDHQPTRSLAIESGNAKLVEETDSQESSFAVNSITGKIHLSNQDGFILMAHGKGDVNVDRLSKNHFLFQARINRDVNSEWRYEAKLLGK